MDGLGTILQANNIHRVAKAKYEQAYKTQQASNQLKAAQGNLANWSRSLGNRRRIEAAELEYNRGMEQLSHETRQMGKQRSNLTLAVAEEQGAISARAAMAGVGGSTIDAMDMLVSLQGATNEEELDQAINQMVHFGKQNMVTGLMNQYMATDKTQTMMDFDYTKHIEPKPMKRRLGKLIGVAVATYFGGPMAGEAVSNLAVGEWQATNADFQGMNKNFGQAMSNGMQAWQDTSDRGGAWGKDVMRGFRASGGGTDGYKPSGGANISKGAGGANKKSWFGKGK